MKLFFRALSYFRSDAWRIGFVLSLLLVSIGLNVLKPWPMALLVDTVLTGKPFPKWVPHELAENAAVVAVTAYALASLEDPLPR